MPFWKRTYVHLLSIWYGFGTAIIDGVSVAGLDEETLEPEGRIIGEWVAGDPYESRLWLTDGRVELDGEWTPGTPKCVVTGYTFAIQLEHFALHVDESGPSRWRRNARELVTWGDVDLAKLRAALKQTRGTQPLSRAEAGQLVTA